MTTSRSVSESTKDSPQLETATLKKGLLWQQWDRFFSRWKERFFVLTRDYLACFKKGSSLGITEMGSFLYKVNLVDVEGLQWVDKKRDGVIAIKVGQDGQLLLWSPKGLDDWMFALRDAISRSKGRREALRKAHTLIPQISETGLLRRQAMTLQHTLSDSHVERSILHSSSAKDFSGSLRSSTEHQPTPHLGKRSQRISVLTDIVISNDTELDTGYDSELCLRPRNAMGPRLAPQCASGSHTSLASLGKGIGMGCGTASSATGISASGFGYGTGFSFGGFSTGSGHGNGGQLYRPSPRSLQVSPALTQRSLYAQHVLSAPEIAPSPEMRQSKSAATNVTSEFSFIRPDSPISRNDSGNGSGGSNGGGTGSGNGGGGNSGNATSSLRSTREYHRSHSCSTQALSSNSLGSNTGTPSRGTPRNGGYSGGGMTDPTRPSSIYGQPSVTVEKNSLFVPKNALQLQQQHLTQPQVPLNLTNPVQQTPSSRVQPDVVPISYQQTKSPSIQHLSSSASNSGGQQQQQQPGSNRNPNNSQQQSIFEQRPHHQHRNHRRAARQYLHSKSDSSFSNVANNHAVNAADNPRVNNNGSSNASHRKSSLALG